MFPVFVRVGRLFEKGFFKYLILEALSERPMHGYEIMKVISEKFSGFYAPSAGVVYPTLQMLEDLGYIKAISEDGKKTYKITDKGRKFVDAREDCLATVMRKHEEILGVEKMELVKELRRFARLFFTNFHEISPQKAERIRKIVEETRNKVNGIMME